MPFVSLEVGRYGDDDEGEEIGGGANADGMTGDPAVTAARELTGEPNSCWNFGGEDRL